MNSETNRLVIIHRPQKRRGNHMTDWITSVLRKIVFAAASGVIAKIVASGVLTQGQIDAWIEMTIAVIAAVLVACWSKWILPWIQKLLGK